MANHLQEERGGRRPLLGKSQRSLHCIGQVRRAEGVSHRSLLGRLESLGWSFTLAEVQELDDPTTDMQLALLYDLQTIFDIPLNELLGCELNGGFISVIHRVQLERIAEMASEILAQANEKSTQCMAQVLVDQIKELDPDLMAGFVQSASAGGNNQRDKRASELSLEDLLNAKR